MNTPISRKLFGIIGKSENANPDTVLCEQCSRDPDIRVKAFNRAKSTDDVKGGFTDCSDNTTLECSECKYRPPHFNDGMMEEILFRMENG